MRQVLRYKATVFNPDLPYQEWQGQFGPWSEFDNGKCTSPGCEQTWKTYGFAVGCIEYQQYMGGKSFGNRTQWYSLPGSCPSQSFGAKSSSCKEAQPGGQCDTPNGSANCTWNLEKAGEVSLQGLPLTVEALAQEFAKQYPKSELPEPTCSSQNAQCQYHEHCRGLSGNCCPATDGEFLSCCTSSSNDAMNMQFIA